MHLKIQVTHAHKHTHTSRHLCVMSAACVSDMLLWMRYCRLRNRRTHRFTMTNTFTALRSFTRARAALDHLSIFPRYISRVSKILPLVARPYLGRDMSGDISAMRVDTCIDMCRHSGKHSGWQASLRQALCRSHHFGRHYFESSLQRMAPDLDAVPQPQALIHTQIFEHFSFFVRRALKPVPKSFLDLDSGVALDDLVEIYRGLPRVFHASLRSHPPRVAAACPSQSPSATRPCHCRLSCTCRTRGRAGGRPGGRAAGPAAGHVGV